VTLHVSVPPVLVVMSVLPVQPKSEAEQPPPPQGPLVLAHSSRCSLSTRVHVSATVPSAALQAKVVRLTASAPRHESVPEVVVAASVLPLQVQFVAAHEPPPVTVPLSTHSSRSSVTDSEQVFATVAPPLRTGT